VALLQGRGVTAGLRPRALLHHQELSAGVVDAWAVEADDHLEREHQVAVEVAVQGFPVALPVPQ
jgi:hypothetical protein